MGSTSQIQVRRLREVTTGTLEAGAMTIIPFESFDISSALSREQPGNVRADRQVADNPATNFDTSGSGKADLIYGAYDDFYEEAFCSAWTTAKNLTALTLTAAAAGNTLTRSAGDWSTDLSAGDLVSVTGLSTNGAHFLARIASVDSATQITLDWPILVDEGPTGSCAVKHSGQLILGTSLKTASYEKWNTGSSVGNEYLGVGVSQVMWEIPYPSKCGVSFSFKGMDQEIPLAAQLANATTAATTNKIINSNLNFGDGGNPTRGYGLRIDDTLRPTLRVKSIKVTVDNPLGADGGAGSFGPTTMYLDGRFNVKVDAEFFRTGAYAETLLTAAHSQSTVQAWAFGLVDNDGNHLVFYLPALQPESPKTSGPGQSGEDVLSLSYVARYADSTDGMIRIARIAV